MPLANNLFSCLLICSLTAGTVLHAQTAGAQVAAPQVAAPETAAPQVAGDEDKEMLNRGRQRDQQVIDEALSGGWVASMKNHDQRISWWREARFGMFIHWGVYSRPGGVWKGEKVEGYAEHDSKVSDYNIVRQTAFKKDPMVWDYDNPAGDKHLHGGINWFDLHPELLPKAQRYVDEKAIPQIRELIARYHPDILWFDTPSKLPLSDFIQLLAKAASRGGNLLMNIGPKGDGTFDAKDLYILQSIGKWMQENGTSIYGTTGRRYQWQSGTMRGENTITGNDNNAVISEEIGVLNLTAGLHELSIRPLEIRGPELMKLLELQLVQSPVDVNQVITEAAAQTKVLLDSLKMRGAVGRAFSPRTIENGQLKTVQSKDWTSGFFPGELWMLYGYTKKEEWKKVAEQYTALMENEKTNATSHDVGFKVYCSFGKGYRLTGDKAYRDIIIQSARTLSTRFNPLIGSIRSWDHHRNLWDFPVIIDNMMNLELLFEATRLTGDSSFYRIAVTHANTTMKNHYRPDYSSYHVVDYDTVTGKVRRKMTWQGANDSSAWARGQAWGLYAYTMCYRYTHDKRYLEQAEHIAAFILHHPNLPADKVPYWDFNVSGDEPRDASAAAVIASGLYELCQYSQNAGEYRAAANAILVSLTDHYRAPVGTNKGFILLHSTGGKPSNTEVDVPINYADYYYLEALLRSRPH